MAIPLRHRRWLTAPLLMLLAAFPELAQLRPWERCDRPLLQALLLLTARSTATPGHRSPRTNSRPSSRRTKRKPSVSEGHVVAIPQSLWRGDARSKRLCAAPLHEDAVCGAEVAHGPRAIGIA